jgi:hypothetical protein
MSGAKTGGECWGRRCSGDAERDEERSIIEDSRLKTRSLLDSALHVTAEVDLVVIQFHASPSSLNASHTARGAVRI